MRRYFAITFSIVTATLCFAHRAVAGKPTTAPASPDVIWCLDHAAQEVPHVAMEGGSFPQASVRLRCYTDLAEAYLSAGQKDAAQKMIDAAMAQLALVPPREDDFSDPSYSIIWVLCKTRNFERAQHLAEQTRENSREMAWSAIAHAYANADQIDAAMIAVQKIPTTGRFAHHYLCSAYQCIAAAHLRAGNPAAAKALLADHQLLTDFNLAIAHLVAGDIAAAEKLLPQIDAPDQQIIVLQKAAYMQHERNNRTEAIRLLDASEAAAARRPAHDPSVYLHNLTSRIAIDDKDGARKDLQLAIAAMNPPKDKASDQVFDTIRLASGHSELGEAQQALALLNGINLSEVNEVMVDFLRGDVARSTALVHARSGDLASARAALPPRTNHSLPPNSEIRDVASAAASAGKLADVKQWAQQSQSPDERFAIYLGAATGLNPEH